MEQTNRYFQVSHVVNMRRVPNIKSCQDVVTSLGTVSQIFMNCANVKKHLLLFDLEVDIIFLVRVFVVNFKQQILLKKLFIMLLMCPRLPYDKFNSCFRIDLQH